MSDTKKVRTDNEASARRVFLGQLGKAAVTAPAIALLAAASSEPVAAQYRAATARSLRRTNAPRGRGNP